MANVTSRIKGVYKQSDFPGKPDEATKQALGALFEKLFPGKPNGEIDGGHAAFALLARNPQLALHVIELSNYIVRDMPWTSTRKDLRQLAIQTLNLHFKCEFSFQAHLKLTASLGVSLEQQAAIPLWRTTNMFTDEQRLVIEYTQAVVSGDVPDELYARVAKHYSDEEIIAITTGISWWAFWAMIINALRPQMDYGYGKPAAG